VLVVDTHAHADHTGGNVRIAQAGSQLVAGNFAQQLGQEGARSAIIVAHENVLKQMSARTGVQAPTPFAAWPTDTFFQTEKDLYFNEEGIQLLHQPKAHTDGDVLVFFRSSDVIAAGDVFNMNSYPVIDLSRGGHVNGVIEALNRIIDLAVSEQFTEGGTRVVPGHGRICDEFDVVEYRDMVTSVRDRVQAMLEGHEMTRVWITPVLMMLGSASASAQVDLTGSWQAVFHEDQPERIPGPALGDYLGLPINDSAPNGVRCRITCREKIRFSPNSGNRIISRKSRREAAPKRRIPSFRRSCSDIGGSAVPSRGIRMSRTYDTLSLTSAECRLYGR